MNDLISVIIPAYNAESRIKFTLESIIAQDYSNIEIIVVNDCSTDETGKISEQILTNSGRKFKIINHANNMGVCASRNTGLQNYSSGKYIAFVDADDLIAENFISCLHELIAQNNSDIAFCGLIDRFTDGRPDKNVHPVKRAFNMTSGGDFIMNKVIPAVWCCIYDKNFLDKYNLLFLEGCTSGEDIDFITRAICVAEKVSFTEKCLYIYMHHSQMGSIRDNNTIEKKIRRYEDNTHAQINTAKYLAENAGSEQVKYLAENILMPQCIIRQANIFIMKHDKAGYKSFVNNEYNRKILYRSQKFYILVKNFEVFCKAFTLLYLPNLYYLARKK